MNETTARKSANGADSFPTGVQRKLRGVILDVPFPPEWRAGHKLTEKEAIFLCNARASFALSAFADRLERNLAPDREGGAMTIAQVHADWAEYYSTYEWSPRGDAASIDPVVVEMRKIAVSELNFKLSKVGRTIVGVDKETRNAAIDKYLSKEGDRIRKTAEKNIAALERAAGDIDADFLGGLGRETKSGSAATAS